MIRKHEHARLEADELGVGLARNVRILREQTFPDGLRVAAIRTESVIVQMNLQLILGRATCLVARLDRCEGYRVGEGGYRRNHHGFHLIVI